MTSSHAVCNHRDSRRASLGPSVKGTYRFERPAPKRRENPGVGPQPGRRRAYADNNHHERRQKDSIVTDVLFLAMLVAFFAIAVVFVHACERIIGPDLEMEATTDGAGSEPPADQAAA
jgi:hypothetical protein